MKTSDQVDLIIPAFFKAQISLGTLKANKRNPAFNKSPYADLAMVWETIETALEDNGLAVMQHLASSPFNEGDGSPQYQATNAKGDTTYYHCLTVSLETVLVHISGQWISFTASCPIPQPDPQKACAGGTYLRRFNLAALMGLVAEKDDDGNVAAERIGGLPPLPPLPPLVPKNNAIPIDKGGKLG